MSKGKSHVTIVLILFIVAAVFIFPYVKKGTILGSGESSIYLRPDYFDYYSLWEDKLNFGIFSAHHSNIALFSIFWFALSIFSEFIHPSVTFIFLSVFLGSLFFYVAADHILKLKNKYLYLPASLLYVYNGFRLIGPLNERQNLLFIFLPLFFLFYHRLVTTKKWIYVFVLVVLSLLSSSLGGNLPVFTVPYVLMLLYFLYYVLFVSARSEIKFIIQQSLSLLFLILLINSYWVVPLVISLLETFVTTSSGNSIFSAPDSGNFFDHIRFLGSWAWQGSHNGRLYYPFSLSYYQPLFVVSTFLISLVAILNIPFSKPSKKVELIVFFNALLLVSIFLLAGTKGPFRIFYALVYRYVPVFNIYREPFTKFMPLFIFAMCFNLMLSLELITNKLKKVFQRVFTPILLSIVVLINAYPLFTTEALPIRRWNGAQWGNLVEVPTYWRELNEYLNKHAGTNQIFMFPYSLYGSSNNWEYGINVAGNVADFLLDKPIVRAWSADNTNSGQMLKNVFDESGDFDLKNYLSLLNVAYVVQENEREWRFSNQVSPPSVSNRKLLSHGLAVEKTFGEFTLENLSKILNEAVDQNLRNEFFVELLDSSALVLYKIDEAHTLPLIYASNNQILVDGGLPEIKHAVSFDDYIVGSSVHVLETDYDPTKLDLDIPMMQYVYLAGEKERFALDPKVLVWDAGWAWPHANVHPDRPEHKLVVLKEFFQRLNSKGSYTTEVDNLVWLSAKRVSELSKYTLSEELENTIFEGYISGVTKAILKLRNVPELERTKDYWEVVKKSLMYMERANRIIVALELPHTDKAIQLYEDFVAWVELTANPLCGEYCFGFNIPESNVYKIYALQSSIENLQSLKLTVVNVFTEEFVPVSSSNSFSSDAGDYWYLLGEIALEKDVRYKLNLELPVSPNLVDDGQWQPHISVSDEDIYGLKFHPQNALPGYIYEKSELHVAGEGTLPRIVLWGDSIRFKRISGWEPNKKYVVSFDYSVSKGGIGVSLLEDVPDYFNIYNKLKLVPGSYDTLEDLSSNELPTIKKTNFSSLLNTDINAYKVLHCDDLGVCMLHFEKVVRSDSMANDAYIYMFAFSDVNAFSDIVLENLSVREIIEPKISLIGEHDVVTKEVPNISFEKLRPTKYVVHVNNARNIYTLIFNQSFHKWWRLSIEDVPIANDTHRVVNGFANSWTIQPEDVGNQDNYDLTIEFWPQYLFELGLILSFAILSISLGYIAYVKKINR